MTPDADYLHVCRCLGAHNICFTRPSHSLFFCLGQTLPTVRGSGVYQRVRVATVPTILQRILTVQAVDAAIEKLDSGKWIHVYSEGMAGWCSVV